MPALIAAGNTLSARPCMVTLTASGSSNPELALLDGGNNVTELLVAVLDKNDH